MMVELGHYSLVLALSLALLQTALPLLGLYKSNNVLADMGRCLAPGQFVLVAFSFVSLIYAYVGSDFSVANVVANSHSAKPLLYRITGAWGNHEGSMLLWVLVLTGFTATLALFSRHISQELRALVLSIQALIASAFFFFILLTSNPFARVFPAPLEGRDLNPLLQDIGLAVHPPLLYVGYVGFSVCYSFALAALLSKSPATEWARHMRPWCLAAWIFLILGIAMGSYWAYYELGWGGFWFWDSVENASFMPWLVGTMLLHSVLVTEKRGSLQRWTLLLAISAFSLSLMGTFLVRSGILTSVHSFATDPLRGFAILVLLVIFIGGALALYAWRAPDLTTGSSVYLVSRESTLVLNNLFLSVATAAVLTGTLYPLLLEALTGDKISVGPPYFNMTFGWAMVPLLLLLPFGPFLAWKKGDLPAAFRKIILPAALSLSALVLITLFQPKHFVSVCGIALAIYVMTGALAEPLSRLKLFRASAQESWQRARGLKLSTYGTLFAHFGIGLSLLGIVCATAFAEEQTVVMRRGETAEIGGYMLVFDQLQQTKGVNYREDSARFTIRQGGVKLGDIMSAKRFYPVRGVPTTEAGLSTHGFSQLYLSLADLQNDAITMRIYYKPLVLLIWLGCVVVAIGGMFSLARLWTKDRKRNEI